MFSRSWQARDHWEFSSFKGDPDQIRDLPYGYFGTIISGQFRATSHDLTEQYQNGLKLGTEIILNYPLISNNSHLDLNSSQLILKTHGQSGQLAGGLDLRV